MSGADIAVTILFDTAEPLSYRLASMTSAEQALIAALDKKSVAGVTEAMRAGANPNVVKPGGRAALLMALLSRSKKLVTALLEAGASVKVADRRGATPLHFVATELPDVALARRLIELGAPTDAAGGPDGRTPLQELVLRPKLALAQALLDGGARVDAPSAEGATALHLVLEQGTKTSLATAKWLIERGADVRAVNEDGNDALNLAVHAGVTDVAFLKFLFAKGARLTTNRFGQTPLHIACHTTSGKPTQLWNFLLEKGCAIDAQDESGNTALHDAASYWNLFAVKYLLGKGADASLTNRKGQSVLEAARALKQTKIIAVLEKETA